MVKKMDIIPVPQAFYRDRHEGTGGGHWVISENIFQKMPIDRQIQLVTDTRNHALNIRYALRQGGVRAGNFVMCNNLSPAAPATEIIAISHEFDAGARKLNSYLPRRFRLDQL